MTPEVLDHIKTLAIVAGPIVSAVGLLFVAHQIKQGQKLTRADLVLRLEAGFATHHYPTYAKFCRGGQFNSGTSATLTPSDTAEIEHYLDFFASLWHLVQARLLDLPTINRMFAYRFFIAANNPSARTLIDRNNEYWHDLLELQSQWASYRRANNFPLLKHEEQPRLES